MVNNVNIVNMSRSKRVQMAIRERVAELQAAQMNRAWTIEGALKVYEKNIRVRNVSEYIDLSQLQRRLMGEPDGVLELYDLTPEIAAAEKAVKKRLEKKNRKSA